LSSFHEAARVARTLQDWIERGEFLLSAPAAPISGQGAARPLVLKTPLPRQDLFYRRGQAALTCASGARITWDAALCFSCGQCLGVCPLGVFRRDDGWQVTAEPAACSGCGLCDGVCPVGAISSRPDGWRDRMGPDVPVPSDRGAIAGGQNE
jgi:ferredoxin